MTDKYINEKLTRNDKGCSIWTKIMEELFFFKKKRQVSKHVTPRISCNSKINK